MWNRHLDSVNNVNFKVWVLSCALRASFNFFAIQATAGRRRR